MFKLSQIWQVGSSSSCSCFFLMWLHQCLDTYLIVDIRFHSVISAFPSKTWNQSVLHRVLVSFSGTMKYLENTRILAPRIFIVIVVTLDRIKKCIYFKLLVHTDVSNSNLNIAGFFHTLFYFIFSSHIDISYFLFTLIY